MPANARGQTITKRSRASRSQKKEKTLSSTARQRTRQRDVIRPGVAVFVDLENVSFLQNYSFAQIVERLRSAYGPVTQLSIYTNPSLVPSIGITDRSLTISVNIINTSLLIADTVLIKDVVAQLPELPKTVAIVSGDGDFIPLLLKIANSGRRPVVVASLRNFSRSLIQTACLSGGTYCWLSRGNGPGYFTASAKANHLRPAESTKTATRSSFRRSPIVCIHWPESDEQLVQPKAELPFDFRFTRHVSSWAEPADHEADGEPVKGRPLEQVLFLKAQQPWHSLVNDKEASVANVWRAWQHMLRGISSCPDDAHPADRNSGATKGSRESSRQPASS